MISSRRMAVLAGVATLLLPLVPRASAATFTEATAPALLRELYAGKSYRFGYLTVPEDRSKPLGKSIRLAVLILNARNATPAAPPIIYLNGGPGGIATDTAAFFEVFDALQARRDIVLIDQRGTGFSSPFLSLTSAFLSQLPAERARYLSQGIDVRRYNTTENAADIADLRVALGYSQVVLFGNSYGSFLAQAVMRSHPQGIAAAVLNGVLPATDTFIPNYNGNTLSGLNALFRDVQRTPAARRAFPQLRRTYFQLLRQLRARPLRMDDGFSVTVEKLQDAMIALLQSSERIEVIPFLISQVVQRRGSPWLRRVLTRTEAPRDFAIGMYVSVLGTDWNQPGWRELTVRRDSRLSPSIFREANAPGSLSIVATVQAWGVPYNPGTTRTPLTSSIPTLLLAGNMEAQTPPRGAEIIAGGLSNSYVLRFPRSGHITGFTPGPPMSALLQFVDNPARRPTVSLAPLRRGNFYRTSVATNRSTFASEAPLFKFLY